MRHPNDSVSHSANAMIIILGNRDDVSIPSLYFFNAGDFRRPKGSIYVFLISYYVSNIGIR